MAKRWGGWKYDKKEREIRNKEIEARNLQDKLKATTSSVRSKDLRDHKNIYLVAETEERSLPSSVHLALQKLSATVLTYLDEEHREVLVSIPEPKLIEYQFKKLPLAIKGPLKNIRELQLNEQISDFLLEDSDWRTAAKPTVLQIIPNIRPQLAENYLSQIVTYFGEKDCRVTWKAPPEMGMLVAEINRTVAEDLLGRSNFIFLIHSRPKGIASSRIRRSSNDHTGIRGKPSSVLPIARSTKDLPIVCVADSGVNEIPALSGLLVEKERFPSFTDSDDGGSDSGHGTPIACLAAKGEVDGSPRARIISYKIYSEDNPDNAFEGLNEAIVKYHRTSRIFVSCINYDDENLAAFARLDSLIQLNNICLVSSAGNIDHSEIGLYSSSYPEYIPRYPVKNPAKNAHVIGVGAVAMKVKANSIAPVGGLSPFTRCGINIERLYQSLKPDIVEHGGNLCHDTLDSIDIGVSTFDRYGQSSNDFAGTSFSAPLIAGALAEIVAKYGGFIHNAETLKAILFMSCPSRGGICMGSGIPENPLASDRNHAVLVSEGTIHLSDLTSKGFGTRFESRISVAVPAGVGQIDTCLVHSDNLPGGLTPTLDTYLQIRARKTGREGTAVSPEQHSLQDAKTYVKFFTWRFEQKSMQARWNFDIIPQSIRPIDPDLRKRIQVRYGCVIVLTAREDRSRPLSDDVQMEMKQWGSDSQ